jgi:NitT/TauT family transport system substrate-binding protein
MNPPTLLRRRQILLAVAGADPLVVGGLPVTCNLTLPIACVAKAANARAGAGAAFRVQQVQRLAGDQGVADDGPHPGRLHAGAAGDGPGDKRIPLKIVSLGHRSGAVIMVRTDSANKTFKDLRGKRIAIPSRFAVDFLFLRKMLAREGMTPKDIEIIEMPPPDMPAALYAKAVDAYCTGEPFGAAAQRAGYARPLSMTRDEWRNYICCVLTVREELIKTNRPLVQDLVNHVQAAGNWLDATPANRDKAVAIAGRKYFNQDPNVSSS